MYTSYELILVLLTVITKPHAIRNYSKTNDPENQDDSLAGIIDFVP